MKTPEQMKEQFDELYNLMSNSNNVAFMRTFGHVHKEMMNWFIANKPEAAEEWLCKLESIKWHNYLTQKEADKIVAGMTPKAPWSRDAWKQAMDGLGISTEEAPCYNSCALYTEMNKMYSDHAETLAKLMGKTIAEIPAETMVKAMYGFAIDNLKDKDHVYNIRSYFKL